MQEQIKESKYMRLYVVVENKYNSDNPSIVGIYSSKAAAREIVNCYNSRKDCKVTIHLITKIYSLEDIE